MNTIKIKKEEFNTTRAEIARAESLWDKNFPKDYVDFLLQFNGAITYPNWPNLGPENKTEIWGVERFYSVGDVIIQKLYPMTYTLHDIEEESFEEHNLDPDKIVVFAQGERGVYFFNLSNEEFGQIYIANFSGGDGISRTSCNSFNEFLNSLGLPEWAEEEIDENFEFMDSYNSSMKVLQWHLFYTPEKPHLGLERFKEVFEYTGDLLPKEYGYPTIAQKYVHDRQKLNYLIEKGCNINGILRYAQNPDTIKYLVDVLKMDINKIYKGRYPLQSYLTPVSKSDIKTKYELMDKLLELGIEMDWKIKGTQVNGEPDLPMIEKLEVLHKKYLEFEIEDKKKWEKWGKPSGHEPFARSRLIEKKLGILKNETWLNQLLNRIMRGKIV